jgi:hypothetical protein
MGDPRLRHAFGFAQFLRQDRRRTQLHEALEGRADQVGPDLVYHQLPIDDVEAERLSAT